MRQQYGAGASFWNTEEGKDLLLDTMSNEYTGDQAGLPGFYQDQAKAGLGQMDKIIESMGYTGDMATWAKNHPALALREYNKRQPNAYSGTGPSDEEIKAAMAAGQFSPSAGSLTLWAKRAWPAKAIQLGQRKLSLLLSSGN